MTTHMKLDKNLICPNCGGDNLSAENDTVRCSNCMSEHRIENGICIFTDKDYFYGETTRDEMRRLLDQIRKDPARLNSLKTGASSGDVKIGDFLAQYMFSENRTSYIDFLLENYGPQGNRTSLDIGCGYGLIGSAMEERGFRNYYIDLTRERLEFAQLRNEFLGRRNGVYLNCGDSSIPVKDNAVGVLLCIGVLEWVACSVPGEDPEEVQTRFLERLLAKIEPGGYMILGIENRYALRYLLGGCDDHTGIRFITFLPRFLAHLYSRAIGKGDYRNYLYGHNGLKEIIKRAGFSEVELFYPHEDYRFAKYTERMDDRPKIEQLLKEGKKHKSFVHRVIDNGLRLLNLLGLFKYFSYSFIVIAKK